MWFNGTDLVSAACIRHCLIRNPASRPLQNVNFTDPIAVINVVYHAIANPSTLCGSSSCPDYFQNVSFICITISSECLYFV